jgi:hypothetical protein
MKSGIEYVIWCGMGVVGHRIDTNTTHNSSTNDAFEGKSLLECFLLKTDGKVHKLLAKPSLLGLNRKQECSPGKTKN